MECSVQMIATLGVVAVLVMLVLAWVMADRAALSGKGSNAEDNKRGGECESCDCTGGACLRPSAD